MSDELHEGHLVGDDGTEVVLNADQVCRLLRLMKLAGEDPDDAVAGS